MVTKVASEFFDVGAVGLPIVDRPVNAAPAEGITVGSQKPTLTSSGYLSLYDRPQLAAEFLVYDATGTTILQQSGVLTPTGGATYNSWQVPVDLPLNTYYKWKHKFRSTFGEDYIESVLTSFFVPTATVGVPIITSPTEGSTPDNLNFDVQGTPFATLGVAQAHDETTLEVATTSDFLTGLQTIVKTTGDLTLVNVTVPNASTIYFIRIKYRGDSTGYSSYSTTREISSVANSIATPVITSPANYASKQQQQISISSGAFTVVGEAQTHDAAEWEVYNDELLTSLFFASGQDPVNLLSITVAGFVEGQTYFVRKRDVGSVTGVSEWSTLSRFSTALTFADWLAWDGTADGIVYQASPNGPSTADYTIAAGKGCCELSFEKFLTLTKGSGNFVTNVEVTGINGISVGGGETVSLNVNLQQDTRIIALSPTKGLAAGVPAGGGILYYQVVNESGSFLTLGTATTSGTAITPSAIGEFDIVSISSNKAVLFYSSTSSMRARVLTITGDVVTAGVEYTVGSADGISVNCSFDAIGNKVLVASESYSPTYYQKFKVLEVNEGASTIVEVASATSFQQPSNVNYMTQTIWLTSLIGVSVNSSSSGQLWFTVLIYDGTTGLTATAQLVSGINGGSEVVATVGRIDDSNCMVAWSDLTDDQIKAVAVEVKDGLAFVSTPVVVDAELAIYSQGLTAVGVSAGRALFTYLRGAGNSNVGTRQVVFNAETV